MQQTILIAGDTLRYTTSVPSYPATSGYTATTRLVRRDGSGSAIEFTATASGSDYLFDVAPATTAAWTPGVYTWAVYVAKAGERYTVDSGELTIRADPATVAAPFDARTHAEKTLAAIEAVLESRASTAQLQFSIAGRQVQFIPLTELRTLRAHYRQEVLAEQDQKRRAQGLKPRNRVAVRFS